MKKETTEIVLVCSTENVAGVAGVDVECSNCKVPLWMSNSTMNSVRQHHPEATFEDTRPLCVDCYLVEVETVENPKMIPPSEEQLEEIKNAIINNP